jgi:hypothetical protein
MPYPRLEPSNSASLVSHNTNKGISPSLKSSNLFVLTFNIKFLWFVIQQQILKK